MQHVFKSLAFAICPSPAVSIPVSVDLKYQITCRAILPVVYRDVAKTFPLLGNHFGFFKQLDCRAIRADRHNCVAFTFAVRPLQTDGATQTFPTLDEGIDNPQCSPQRLSSYVYLEGAWQVAPHNSIFARFRFTQELTSFHN
ncbi:MAG: hypothetical protein DWQ35_21730 [Planctomycetota bacterium]|nr:MAG: hypothetical protein DWQ35_21730 [Planctomycetota bacterium]REK31623.1 MAG: hypothetical protein DWQ42_00035 [Planctomycetota bacterium]